VFITIPLILSKNSHTALFSRTEGVCNWTDHSTDWLREVKSKDSNPAYDE